VGEEGGRVGVRQLETAFGLASGTPLAELHIRTRIMRMNIYAQSRSRSARAAEELQMHKYLYQAARERERAAARFPRKNHRTRAEPSRPPAGW